jgi:hypothetical protein
VDFTVYFYLQQVFLHNMLNINNIHNCLNGWRVAVAQVVGENTTQRHGKTFAKKGTPATAQYQPDALGNLILNPKF